MALDGSLTILHSFERRYYEVLGLPGKLITGSDGSIYGLTGGGGYSGFGTVFRMALDGTFTTLREFGGWESPAADGNSPSGFLQGSDGALYGATLSGGAANAGLIYRITTTGSFTSLYSFVESPEGTGFRGGLVAIPDGGFIRWPRAEAHSIAEQLSG
jgi:uncharacterized repeat protein (TIGR03803 family)